MRRRISAALLTLCMLMSLVPSVAFAAPNGTFDDVNDHWGKDAIERWAGYGVVNGDGSGSFAPDKQMTRAEFATMLANMLGYKEKAANTFADVNDGDWFADAILKLAAAGVMQGSNGMANPNAPITRQEAAVLMCRAFNIPTTGGNLDFADSADVADWAKGAVAALADRGMMNGVGDNNVAPLADINRASVATLLDNMITEYVTEDKTITGEVSGIVLVAADATVTVENATLSENLIVAPKADGAEVALTGTTTASDVVVGATATVKVDSTASAGTVQVEAANSTVEVAGKADAVVVAESAEGAKANVTETAEVKDVTVAAPNAETQVAGKVESVAVAPTAEGAKANVTETAEVKDVTVAAPKAETQVAGKVETVSVAPTAEGAKANVAANAEVKDMTVAAPNTETQVAGKVENVTVTETAKDVTVNTSSGAQVGNVTTEAEGTTVSGSGKVDSVIATGNADNTSVTTSGTKTENKTESGTMTDGKGNETKPGESGTSAGATTSGGNSGGGHQYAVTVTSTKEGNGTVTLTNDKQDGTTAGGTTTFEAVTVTVAADPQKGSVMPYVVKSVTLATKPEGSSADLTNNQDGTYTFTPDKAGTYTVGVKFEQPITEAALFIVNDEASYKKLKGYDYSSENEAYELTSIENKPWLAMGVKRNNDYTNTEGTVVMTANRTDVSEKWGHNKKVPGKYATSYVNGKDDTDVETADKMELAGSSYKFVATFTFGGASYELSCDYTKPDATDLKTVTFKAVDSEGKDIRPVDAFKGQANAEGDTFTVPALPDIAGYYKADTNWKTTGDKTATPSTTGTFKDITDDITYTAKYIKIGNQELQTRPDGPAGNQPNFEYGKAYEAAGVKLSGTPGNYTYTITPATFLNYSTQNSENLEKLASDALGSKYYYYGVAIMAPNKNAAKMVITKDNNLTSLDDSSKYTEFVLSTSEHAFDTGKDNTKDCILHYFGAVAIKENESDVFAFQDDATFTRYVKWLGSDGNIIAVNKFVLARKTESVPTYTVTFTNKGVTTSTKTVAYGGTISDLPNPTEDGSTFDGWYYGADNNTKFDTSTVVTKNIELTAKWTTATNPSPNVQDELTN